MMKLSCMLADICMLACVEKENMALAENREDAADNVTLEQVR